MSLADLSMAHASMDQDEMIEARRRPQRHAAYCNETIPKLKSLR